MNNLADGVCEACRIGAPRVTQDEIDVLMPEIPNWSLQSVDGVDQLRRVFAFSNFVDAMAFTNRVAELAEQSGHHPALLTEWGRVTVSWWTHKIKGLHRNDFIMAAKTDLLFS